MIEKMSDFFAARARGYEEHMLNEVEGCREGYEKMAALLPEGTRRLLDLGCGTGLELDGIFRRYPGVSVTGIDLTQTMLDILRRKHPDRDLTLLCADYFEAEFGENRFDAAVSFQTMHHFGPMEKTALYRKLLRALRPGGIYIEGDFTAQSKQEEDSYAAEARRLRDELPAGERYHIDLPFTAVHQTALLRGAGFATVKFVWKGGNTAIFTAEKASAD